MGTKSSGELRSYRALIKRCLPALLCVAVLSGCGALRSRPVHQMSYAEAALRSAASAGAETSQPYLFQLSHDALLRARSAYRLKNFDSALRLAIRARRIAEDAEAKALGGQIETEKVYPVNMGDGAEVQ